MSSDTEYYCTDCGHYLGNNIDNIDRCNVCGSENIATKEEGWD